MKVILIVLLAASLSVGMTMYYWHYKGGSKRFHVEWMELKRVLR